MELDIRVLKYFLAVTQAGNMTQAAKDLRITQPTLSRQIMDSEHNLGTKLFVRKHKQLTLSDSDFLFQQKAKEIAQPADKACREIAEQKAQMQGTVTIACVERRHCHCHLRTKDETPHLGGRIVRGACL